MKTKILNRFAAMLLAICLLVSMAPAALAATPDEAAGLITAANAKNTFHKQYGGVTLVEAGKDGIVSYEFDVPSGLSNPGSPIYAAVLPVGSNSADDVRYVRLTERGGKLDLTYFRSGHTSFYAALVQAVPDGGNVALSSSVNEMIHSTSRPGTTVYTSNFTATLNMSAALAQLADLYSNNPKMNSLTFTAHIRFAPQIPAKVSNVTLDSGIFETTDLTAATGENGYDIACTLKDSWKDTKTGQTLVEKLQETMTFRGSATVTGTDIINAVNGGSKALHILAWITLDNVPLSDKALGATSSTLQVSATPYSITLGVLSGGGGGGGTIGDGLPVDIATHDGGTVTSDHATAKPGDRVTFTVSPNSGYRSSNVVVTDANGKRVEVTDNGNGTYFFIMPDSGVTIDVTFAREVADPATTGVGRLLNYNDHIAYMQGDTAGTFRPEANITRAEAAQTFYNLLLDKNVSGSASFTDVASTAWYYKAVTALANLGIINGVGGGKFEPERNIKRSEFVAIAMRFANTVEGGSNTFVDVPSTHWAYSYINGAVYYGWIEGRGGNVFAPDANITRAEAATVVNRMLGRAADKSYVDANLTQLRLFPDVAAGSWYYYTVIEATNRHEHTGINDNEKWTGLN